METGAGGSEVRKVHIVYFVSHMGHIQHPHLIRVQHLSRNGVYLRDVKRWLADLRGKDMPEAFSWSFKRRYKSGYIWQDLADDDLITPISDKEYVLKGSEIVPVVRASPFESSSQLVEKTAAIQGQPVDVEAVGQNTEQRLSPTDTPQKHPLRTPDSVRWKSTNTSVSQEDASKDNTHRYTDKYENQYIYRNDNNDNSKDKIDAPSQISLPSPKSPYTKCKSYSSGASQIFRNLLSCGAVDTNDAALIRPNRAGENYRPIIHDPVPDTTEINCKVDRQPGILSARALGTPWIEQRTARSFDGAKGSKKKKQAKFCSPNVVSPSQKPVSRPTCSHCGKLFNPEKLHTHMMSCKGMKSLGRTAVVSVEKMPMHRPVNSSDKSASGHFLTY